MQSFIDWLSSEIYTPFYTFATQFSHFALVAFFLGIAGVFTMSQIGCGICLLAYFGQQHWHKKAVWRLFTQFILGKIVAYSLIAALFWFFEKKFQNIASDLFPVFYKLTGPFLIFVGLISMGLLILPKLIRTILQKQSGLYFFLIGFFLSLAFCSTMTSIFFNDITSQMINSQIGIIIPTIFAIGTTIPILILLLFFSFIFRKSSKTSTINQPSKWIGILFILVGIVNILSSF